MDEVSDRYQKRADRFEALVAAVPQDRWEAPSPCAEWTARDVVGHVLDMHGAMLGPLGREPSPAPAVADDPLAAFRAARADIEAVLADPVESALMSRSPAGDLTVADHIDQVASADLVIHGWDLARATGQDDTIDPAELTAMWPELLAIPDKMRVPEAFGPGIIVYGPKVEVAPDASQQDRALGLLGRDPNWAPAPSPGSSPRISSSSSSSNT